MGWCLLTFMTMVLPAASAGPSFQACIRMGKFQGMICPTTPARNTVNNSNEQAICFLTVRTRFPRYSIQDYEGLLSQPPDTSTQRLSVSSRKSVNFFLQLTEGFPERVGLHLAVCGDGLPVDFVSPARIVAQVLNRLRTCVHMLKS